MSHLNDLICQFCKSDNASYKLRRKLVLEMIEYSIAYPPLENCEREEIQTAEACIEKVARELKKMGEDILAARILRIWKRREHLRKLAENANHYHHDYMDALAYHEEVMWIRNEQRYLGEIMEP